MKDTFSNAVPDITPQNYDAELLKEIEALHHKRSIVNTSIDKNQTDKVELQEQIKELTEKLGVINSNLEDDILSKNDYDKTIMETEAAHERIRQSSQVLLDLLKRESNKLASSK